ncbi:hypothetical protein ACJ73_03027 [Blastomyces percursus]|uniref:Uncharacterized protein n=1 Tax=Blastomyces percursus TaxID=1658174 RepID=A0A1J9QBZ4_9EURO|nr:hypothetical protein ACJ73_03027 [Blastomyces percursus]
MELNNNEWPDLARWNQELDVPGDLMGNELKLQPSHDGPTNRSDSRLAETELEILTSWNSLDFANSVTSHSVNQNGVNQNDVDQNGAEIPLSLPSMGSPEMTTTETHCQTTQLSGSCQCSEKLLQLQEEIKMLWKDKIEKLCIYIQESLQPWTESITERIDDLTNKYNPPEDMDISYQPMADVETESSVRI